MQGTEKGGEEVVVTLDKLIDRLRSEVETSDQANALAGDFEDLRAALQVEAQPSPPIDDDHPILLAIREAVATELEACGYRDEEGEPLFADGCEWIANEISNRVKPLLANHPDPQPSVEPPPPYTGEMVDAAAESMATLDGFSDMHPVSLREGLLLALDRMFSGQPSVEQGVVEQFFSEIREEVERLRAMVTGTHDPNDSHANEVGQYVAHKAANRLTGALERLDGKQATKGTDHEQ